MDERSRAIRLEMFVSTQCRNGDGPLRKHGFALVERRVAAVYGPLATSAAAEVSAMTGIDMLVVGL